MSEPAADRGGQDGFLTVQFVAAVALSLVLLTVVANLVVFQYARGVVVAALDEGARAGSRVAAGAAECERRAAAAVADVLAGDLGRQVTIRCEASPEAVTARAEAVFEGFAPGVPDWRFVAEATAAEEVAP